MRRSIPLRLVLGLVMALSTLLADGTANATVSGENGKIAFVSGAEQDIFVVNPDGSGLVDLTSDPASDRDPVWSPDGRKIAFTSNRDGVSAIWLMNGDGSNAYRLTPGASPAWSPDGGRIAFSRDGSIWVLTIGASEAKITSPVRPGGAWSVSHRSPAWSPDGQTIAFAEHITSIGSPIGHGGGLYVVRPDGSGLRQVPNVFGSPLSSVDWSPDGSRFVMIEGWLGAGSVVTVDADGANHLVLPHPPGFDSALSATWAPDGKHILATYIHRLGLNPAQTFLMEPDGSDPIGLGFSGSDLSWQALNPYPVGAVDPTTGVWYLRHADASVTSFYFGNPGDSPFLGDWDGDGVETPGLYRPSDGFVYLRNSNTQGVADRTFFFGNPGDVPIVGDFDGDGFDTVSVYRPSEQRFYIINELGADGKGMGAAEFSFLFGNPGDKPYVGDFDGDGMDEVGLHRESTGRVYFRHTLTTGVADVDFIFGNPGDRLVAFDWNGDGKESPAVFRPANSTFYFRFTNTQGTADAQFIWGNPSWLPVAGDF